jgi:glycosyltransferase involved in cell wall biosynthesis
MPKLIRITTVPISLDKLLEGQLRFMNQHFEVTVISGEADYLKKIEQREGVATHTVEMTRKITPIKDLIALWKLCRYFLKHQPDIVHTHTPKAGLLGMLAARICRVPLRLHTVAGMPLMETTGAKRKLLMFVEKITYACAHKVYPNSIGLHEFIIGNKLTASRKVKVIGKGSTNGINTQDFNPEKYSTSQNEALRKQLNINPDHFVFIFIGRLVKDKGLVEMIEAFSNLYQENNRLRLLLVGPLEQDLDPLPETTLQQMESHPGILTTGYLNDVKPYLAIANALVFPSYREGFPNVVMQAGAMGLPAIVSNINGCNEIIQEGVNGLIIPPKEVAPLQTAMHQLATQPELFQSLQSNARKTIVEKYEQQTVWNHVLKEYLDQLR